MAFQVRILTMIVVTMMAPMLQVSHAMMYKVGDSVGWTKLGNIDHYNKRGAADQIPSMLTFGGLNNGGGDHHQQEEVDGLSLHAHKRTLFLSFNTNYPSIDEQEVINFFTKKFGDVESYIQRAPSHAFIVFRKTHSSAILQGSEKKFVINGIYVWANKYIP